jgi:predicted protein tyrosine phosphatase
MSKIAYNIPRRMALNATYQDPEKHAWISIQEPDDEHIASKLDACPNLKLKFWDVTIPLQDLLDPEEYYYPASDEDIRDIFQFLMLHKDKHIISNCAAGVSRSGAISRFCHEFLGHEWDQESRNRSYAHIGPNKYIFEKLVEEWNRYHQLNNQYDPPKPTPLIVNDKRRKFD